MLEIRVERVVPLSGKYSVKVLSFKALGSLHLPDEYLADFPRVYSNWDSKILYIFSENEQGLNDVVIRVGDTIPMYVFEDILYVIRAAGERLYRINRKLSSMRRNWQGTTTYRF